MKYQLDEDLLEELANSDEHVSYTHAVNSLLKGKLVEIYLGDNFKITEFSDEQLTVNSVLIGTVLNNIGDCLIVRSYVNPAASVDADNGAIVLVNSYSIKAIAEFRDDTSLNDCFFSMSREKKNNKIR